MSSPEWQHRVFIVPRETLGVPLDGKPIPMHMLNNSPIRLAFKLKSTRSKYLKPSISSGFLGPNGGCAHVFLTYKPTSDAKPLGKQDRLTVLMTAAPDGYSNWETCAARAGEAACMRFVIKIREQGSPDDSEAAEADKATEDDDA